MSRGPRHGPLHPPDARKRPGQAGALLDTAIRSRALTRPPRNPVRIYTDGACSGNPGPGGWAAILIDGGQERELSGGSPSTTNQRMELTGAVEGLRALDGRQHAALYSDSAYLINCFRDTWYLRWLQNGWKNAQKKPVENRDLWEALIALAETHDVTWHKVAGHSGDPLNERADRLARAAIGRLAR